MTFIKTNQTYSHVLNLTKVQYSCHPRTKQPGCDKTCSALMWTEWLKSKCRPSLKPQQPCGCIRSQSLSERLWFLLSSAAGKRRVKLHHWSVSSNRADYSRGLTKCPPALWEQRQHLDTKRSLSLPLSLSPWDWYLHTPFLSHPPRLSHSHLVLMIS